MQPQDVLSKDMRATDNADDFGPSAQSLREQRLMMLPLMLMMLATLGLWFGRGALSPADAHVLVWSVVWKVSAAAAHDAGPIWGVVWEGSAADAHDASPVWCVGREGSAADAVPACLFLLGRS